MKSEKMVGHVVGRLLGDSSRCLVDRSGVKYTVLLRHPESSLPLFVWFRWFKRSNEFRQVSDPC